MTEKNFLDTPQGQQLASAYRRGEFIRQFAGIDRKWVASLDDKALSEWQSGFPPDSPQAHLAGFEWLRRLNAEQIKAGYRAALIGVAGTLLGVVLGALLARWLE